MSVVEFTVELCTALVTMIFYIIQAVVLFFIPRRWRHKDVSGQTVLITGAGSGLGRGMSVKFAQLGCRLVLWDVNTAGNEETARLVTSHGAEVHAYTVDLCKREQIYDLADKVKAEVGDVDILVNNAGIVTGKKFMDCSDNLIQRTMDVNTMAHFWTVKSFLPSMMARNHGHIVTTASSAGLCGVRGMADYCASKFAAVGFHESLESELYGSNIQGIICPYYINTGMFEGRKLKIPFIKGGINMTMICPYYIDTGMFDGIKIKIPFIKEASAVEAIMDAILTNTRQLVLPGYLCIALVLKSLFPVQCTHILAKVLGISTAMDEFKGRPKTE